MTGLCIKLVDQRSLENDIRSWISNPYGIIGFVLVQVIVVIVLRPDCMADLLSSQSSQKISSFLIRSRHRNETDVEATRFTFLLEANQSISVGFVGLDVIIGIAHVLLFDRFFPVARGWVNFVNKAKCLMFEREFFAEPMAVLDSFNHFHKFVVDVVIGALKIIELRLAEIDLPGLHDFATVNNCVVETARSLRRDIPLREIGDCSSIYS
jgi:hypothetical protein